MAVALAALTVQVPLFSTPAVAAPDRISGAPDVIWFDEPLTGEWQNQALPIGNGALGATVFGGTANEQVQLNEKTLWTGGPGADGGYNYGNWTDESRTPALIDQARQMIADSPTGGVSPNTIASLLGQGKTNFGAYQNLGSLNLAMTGIGDTTNYRRQLDLGDSLVTTTFTAGGVDYKREYFASAPDDVIVVRLTASQPGKIGFTAEVSVPAARSNVVQAAVDGKITTSGTLTNNGLRWESQLKVLNEGGSLSNGADTVTVADANAVTLVFSAATDYSMDYASDYRSGINPNVPVTAAVDAAAARAYSALLDRHQADYRSFYDRVKLDLKAELPDIPTEELLDLYQSTIDPESARALESLFFQYGRYLLISSSRAGSLPANLQGVWNNVNNPPWDADYHVNINLQMNYWLANTTNLDEMNLPLFDYVESMVAPGKVSAKRIYGTDGWVVGNETNPYGFTGVHNYAQSFWQPDAAAWLAQHFWQQYLFTQDQTFLTDRVYPMLKEIAEFWIDFLVKDTDGTYVVNPSYSPEQGDFTAGASMSQQIVTEFLGSVIQAAELAGETDQAFLAAVNEKYANIYPGVGIGSWGQLKEWKVEQALDNPNNDHRHVSHLWALFPGNAVSPVATPEFAKAAETSLNARGDGGTGWSKAWKINFWARLLDGDHAHKLLSEQLKSSTYDNLWDAHPPFQIDGNFGATSGIAEMLVQSQAGQIDVLPALPSSWPEGSVSGMKARGDVTIGASWLNNSARTITISPAKTGALKVGNGMFQPGLFTLTDSSGSPVQASASNGVVTFNGVAGETYTATALAVLSITAPAAATTGDSITATVKLESVSTTGLGAGTVTIGVPSVTAAGQPAWAADPATFNLGAVPAGGSVERTVAIAVGVGSSSGLSALTATWSLGEETKLTATTSMAVEPLTPCPVPSGTLVAWNLGAEPEIDQSGKGRHPTVQGGTLPNVAEGPTGSAKAMGATDSNYIRSADDFSLGYLREVTFASEIYLDSGQSGYRRLFDHRNANSDSDGVMVDVNGSNRIRVITAGSGTQTNATVPTGRWINLVVSISRAGQIKVYVDGEQVGSTSTIGGYDAANACTSRALHIGANRSGGERQRGMIDRFAIFGEELSGTEIANWQKIAFPLDKVTATADTRCVAGRAILTVTVANGEQTPVDLAIDSAYGAKEFDGVVAGGGVFHAFTQRTNSIAAGVTPIKVSGVVDGQAVSTTIGAVNAAATCG